MRIYNLSIPRVLHLLNLDTFFEADFAQKVKTKSVCLVLSSDVNLILYVKVGYSRKSGSCLRVLTQAELLWPHCEKEQGFRLAIQTELWVMSAGLKAS